MADEIINEELLRLMKCAIIKIDKNAKEISLLRKDFDKNTRELKGLKKEIRANSGIDDDVMFRVLEMFNRLFDIEKQVKSFANLEKEHSRIFSGVSNLAEDIDNPDIKVQLDELNVWLESLEEKSFA